MRACSFIVSIVTVLAACASSRGTPQPAARPAAPAAPAATAPGDAGPDLGFIALETPSRPDPAAVITSAKRMGLELAAHAREGELQVYRAAGVTYTVELIAQPLPPMPSVPQGPTTPDPAAILAAKARLITSARGLAGTARVRDAHMAAFTAAVVENTPAVGAMLGHGALFHKPAYFVEVAAVGLKEGGIAPELAIDITVARESETRMSFLTYNMPRYGREDFYVTCPIDGEGALDFVLGLVRWMLTDLDKQLPTGDTVGRTEAEKVKIQRVPNPTNKDVQVIRLDLP